MGGGVGTGAYPYLLLFCEGGGQRAGAEIFSDSFNSEQFGKLFFIFGAHF